MVRTSNCLAEGARQTGILLKKNFIVMFRNPGATIVQVIVPVIFVFLLFLLDRAVRANSANNPNVPLIVNSTDVSIGPIPKCVLQPLQPACWSFAYEPSDDPLVTQIIDQIRRNNNLDPESVIGFRTESEVHNHLFNNPNSTYGAYHIKLDFGCDANPFGPVSLADDCHSRTNRSASEVVGIRYAVQYNTTTLRWRGRSANTNYFVQLPMIASFDRAIFQLFGKTVNVTRYDVSLRRFPKPEILSFNAVATASPFLFFAALMFNFVIQVGAVVQEKELKLRESMRVMGLLDSAYWLSWSLVNVFMALVASLLLCGAGAAFQFSFFLDNDFLTYFLLFFLFGVSMVPVAFVVSTLLDSSATATTLGFVIFLVGSLIQFFSPVIYQETGPLPAKIIMSFFPFIMLAKGLTDLSVATSSDTRAGIRFSEITAHTSSWPLSQVYWWLAVDIAVYTVLYILLDNVLYMKRPVWFFLTPSYWRGPTRTKKPIQKPSGLKKSDFGDVDVADEFEAIQTGAINDQSRAVVIQDLQKTYTKTKFCCIPDKKTTFKAVRGVSFTIEQGTLLCLLGHNGAGKTTTIGMLTGLFPSSGGDARIFGHSIVNEMEDIRSVMGVCPQHDILWNMLTAREHLELFAKLKNLQGDIDAEIDARLKDVSLQHVADIPAGSYSGGMKRRLSVAVALIGDPKIVFLDEPTTGMDPVSRREVWNLIERVKHSRVTLLTTHSMEEADILGDRIAIMKGGLLASLGTALRLKNKYGSGYTVSFVTDPRTCVPKELTSFVERHLHAKHSDVDQVQSSKLRRRGKGQSNGVSEEEENVQESVSADHIQQVTHLNNVVSYKIPPKFDDYLPDFFESVEKNQKKLGIKDYQLSMTTLEEVFLRVADEDEHKNPDAAAKPKLKNPFNKYTKSRNILIGVAVVLALLSAAALLMGFLIKSASPLPSASSRSAEPPALFVSSSEDFSFFPSGVIVGDVTSSAAVISIRTNATSIGIKLFKAEGNTRWVEVSTFSNLRTLPACSGCSAYFKNDLRALAEDSAYSVYAFDEQTQARSSVTRFRTLPTQSRKITFGISGSFGKRNPLWSSLKNASAEGLDFFLLGGDTIYAQAAASAKNYSDAWVSAFSKQSLRNLSASTSFYSTWADGEAGDINWATASQNPGFTSQLQSAIQQFEINVPAQLSRSEAGATRLWRRFSLGAAADLIILDTRTERNSSHIVSVQQMEWLKKSLLDSSAKFKLVLSGVPFTDITSLGVVFPFGSWTWFSSQRNEVLNHILDNKIPGVMFLSSSARFGGYSRVNTSNPDTTWGVQNVTEVLAGPVGTVVHPSTILNPQTAFATNFLSPIVDTWTYTKVTLDPVSDEARIQFIDDTGQPVADVTHQFIRR